MEIITAILKNTSPLEILLFAIVIYFLSMPDFRKRITKIKIGAFELELEKLKTEVQKHKEQIVVLEEEVENERRLFEDILNSFDPNATVKELAEARQAIKAEARNLNDLESLRDLMTLESSAEEMYTVAVTLREKRSVSLLPDLIDLLDQVACSDDLGGYRLNTIWTLTSALHLTLITCIRDGVEPKPSPEALEKARVMLLNLKDNRRVKEDHPTKGINKPLNHALNWVEKGLKIKNEDS